MGAIDDIHAFLTLADEPPSDPLGFARWLECHDALKFVISGFSGHVPVYVSSPSFFLYAVFVPSDRLVGEYGRDLLTWNFSPSSGWGYSYGFGPSGSPSIESLSVCEPLDNTGTTVLQGGEPLLFLRDFDGRKDQSSYLELNQRFAHLAGVHWVQERNAYCKLDENGRFTDAVMITRRDGWHVCAVDATILNAYMFLTKQALVRVFDVTRFRDAWSFDASNRKERLILREDLGLFARAVLAGPGDTATTGYLRGAHVVRFTDSPERMMRLLRGEPLEGRKCETFIAHDWKHGSVHDCSCDPAQLGNYFVESDLPFGTSPASFNAEVLLKYKQDPDRYTITQDSISCRGAWHLERYGINDAGQVFLYLMDLGRLPYAEQLHWKSQNERPKAGLPKVTFARDFKGEWASEHDPLAELKELLRGFPQAEHDGQAAPIWTLGGRNVEQLLGRLHYVVTESQKEWGDEILGLAKVVVEGLRESAIRRVASATGCDNPDLRSIKLLRECLKDRAVDDEVAGEICDPLSALWTVRSKVSAHLGDAPAVGDLAADYRQRVEKVLGAMTRLADLIRAGALNLPSPSQASGAGGQA